MDETFIGGKSRNMHLSKRRKKITAPGPKDKVAVLGMIERGGEVRTFVVPTTRRSSSRRKSANTSKRALPSSLTN